MAENGSHELILNLTHNNTFKRKGEYRILEQWEEELDGLIDLMSEVVLDQLAE